MSNLEAELEKLSKELLDRLDTEAARPPETKETTTVGGIAKIGSKLEQLMKASLCYVADALAQTPDALLAAASRGKPPSLRKATLGPLAYAMQTALQNPTAADLAPLVLPLLHDMARRPSSILSFVSLRNDAIHSGRLPAGAVRAARDLKAVVVELRKRAGWR